MKPKRTLLAMLIVSAWCLASSAHATNTTGQGHNGDHGGTSSSSQGSASTHVYGDSTDTGRTSSGNLASPHPASPNASHGNDCDDGGASPGINPSPSACSNNRSGGDTDGAADNSQSGLGWQSLLPGSIQ